jgi:long-chain acyl-CoA synthetase
MNIAYLVQRRAVDEPDAPAMLAEDGPPLDWRGFAERVARLSAALVAHGVKPLDRVALLAPNGPEFLEIVMACASAGIVIVPLNYRLSPPEIAFQMGDADCALWFVHERFAELAAKSSVAVPVVPLGPGTRDYEALIASAEPASDYLAVAGDHPLGIFYTGGTTGLPKGVVLTHQNMISNSSHIAPVFGYCPSDVHLHVAPMFHLADLGAAFGHLFAGGAHAFLPQFEPAAMFEAIERHRATTSSVAPTMLDMMLRHPAVTEHDLSSMRMINYGGSPITETVLRRALKLMPCHLFQGYGQTEATMAITLMRHEEHLAALDDPALLRSCGRPLDGIVVRIVDAEDRPLPPGETGELVMRGPTMMRGYWRRKAETAAALAGGWLHTGDFAARDAHGYVTIVDRKKDMIVSGGENVYSAEVESALSSHPQVVEAAIIAVPDETYGERVHAVVALRPGVARDCESLQLHCRARIAGYKIPRSFSFVEALPKTPTGKIRKTELRAPFWEGRDRAVN